MGLGSVFVSAGFVLMGELSATEMARLRSILAFPARRLRLDQSE